MWQRGLFSQKAQRVALADVYKKFVEIYLPSKYGSPITRRGYAYDVQEWLDHEQMKYVDNVDLAVVQHYLATGKNFRLKPSTKQRKVAALKAFFTYLEQTLHLLPKDFSAAMIWPEVEKDDPRYLTSEQYQAILREARDNPRDLAMLEVLLQTGIRLSELTGLKLDDVDLPEMPSPDLATGYGMIRVKRKGGKVKELPLNYVACQALVLYKRERPQSDYPAFFLTKYLTPMTNRSVEKAVKKYAVAAGIEWSHVNTLRTTHIVQHIAAGTDLKTVQVNAGHSSVATTNAYADLVKQAQIKAMQEHAL